SAPTHPSAQPLALAGFGCSRGCTVQPGDCKGRSKGGDLAGGRGSQWVLCCFSVPGTFVSAFTVLCGARTDLPDRHMCCVFWLNIAAALIQILTAIVMVGWIMSIFWGMDMVILAIASGHKQTEQGTCQKLFRCSFLSSGTVNGMP
uniref:Stum, mechanosensory transduction mediator homolog n=1 Tax=Cyanistes caeruleus TaxID=156563 RepID=A0A8C0V0L0_CYACU